MPPLERIYSSSYAPPVIPTNISISQLLQRYNPDDADANKIIVEDDWTGRTLTYAGLREQSAKGAYGLRHVLGVQEGDVVCICAPNSVDVVRLIHAVLWSGAVAVLVNPLSTEYELANCFDISRPEVIAADASTWPALRAASDRQGLQIEKVISLHEAHASLQDATTLEMLFDQKDSLPAFDLSQRDSRDFTAAVCFSSGTSGKAKGVEISHYNFIATLLSARASTPPLYSGDIRGVFFAPLCHIYGLVTVALLSAYIGFYTMVQKRFTLDAFLELSARVQANTLRILPTIAVAISKQTSFDLSRLAAVKLILCTGAVLPPSTIAFFRARIPNAPIFQGYGMTETSITMLGPLSAHRVGSVGKLFATIEARIVDDDGNDVAEGAQGEMLVRGPMIFRRYMRNEAATREALEGEWLKTGDMVRVDAEGFWYLTERKKELIKYKGNQVPPAELEAHLNSHPSVSEGAVCALWDEDQGTEVPIGYIALTAKAKAETRDLGALVASIREHVDSKVSSYKRLRGGVVVLDDIPRSSNGKVLRRMLPARLARERGGKL